MDWQRPVAQAIVAVTAGIFAWRIFLRRRIRPLRFPADRDTPCGCAGGASRPRPVGLVVYGRRGESPKVVLRYRASS